MATDPKQRSGPGRASEIAHIEKYVYRPERPADVVDVPPENLPPPSAESSLSDSPPASDGGSGDGNPGGSE